uniref:Uncharacterized protein n=1 Tax=Arundo donax TaxID=35708 RepID=A0A0A9FZ61_ARUDO
MFFFIVLNSLI